MLATYAEHEPFGQEPWYQAHSNPSQAFTTCHLPMVAERVYRPGQDSADPTTDGPLVAAGCALDCRSMGPSDGSSVPDHAALRARVAPVQVGFLVMPVHHLGELERSGAPLAPSEHWRSVAVHRSNEPALAQDWVSRLDIHGCVAVSGERADAGQLVVSHTEHRGGQERGERTDAHSHGTSSLVWTLPGRLSCQALEAWSCLMMPRTASRRSVPRTVASGIIRSLPMTGAWTQLRA